MKVGNTMKINSPILEGSHNTRELGGYPCKQGKTRFNRFIRSDSICRLTASDRELLQKKGLSLIIDLRSEFEVQFSPDPDLGVEYVNYPLLDQINSGITAETCHFELNEMYSSLLVESSGMILKIMNRMAETEGCILFHCSAGKDRTGIIAMLLLDLAGVDHELIAQDYAVSSMNLNPYIQDQLKYLKAHGISNAEALLSSSCSQIMGTMNFIERNFKSTENYLLRIGMNEQQIDKLKASWCTGE